MVHAIVEKIFKHSTPAIVLKDSHSISGWPVEANQVKHVQIPIPAENSKAETIHAAMSDAALTGLKVVKSQGHYRIEGARPGHENIWGLFVKETLNRIPHRPTGIIDSELKTALDTLFEHSKPAFVYRGSKPIRMKSEPVDLTELGHVRIPYTRENLGKLTPAIDALKERGLKVISRDGYITIEITRSRENYKGQPAWVEFAKAALERAGFRVT